MSKGKWYKKFIGFALTAAMLVGVLAGCNNPSSSTAPQGDSSTPPPSSGGATGEQVEISFLHIWPEHEELMNRNIAAFEAENPGIKIVTTVIPWDQLTRTLQTGFAGGDAPDVTVAWLDRMGGFKAIGAPLDLTPYMDADGGAWKNSFTGSALSLGTVGDEILGIPFRTTCTILSYNKTMLEENNWELPTTLEEFEALNELVVAAGYTPLLAPGNPEGFQIASLTRTFAEHELYASGKLQDPEYLSGYMSDVADEYAAAGARVRNWMDKGWISPDSLALTGDAARSQFFTGKALFFFANNNELTSLRDMAEEASIELGFLGFPAPAGMPQLLFNLGVDGFFINNNTEYPDECVAFMQYMTSEEVQSTWAVETLSVMGNRDVSYADPDQAHMAAIFDSGESYRIKFTYSQGSLITDEAIAAADFMSDPSMTPEEYGEAIQKLKETCIKENG